MILPRREFLKLLGVSAGAVGLGGCRAGWSVPDHLVELAQRGPGLESKAQTICGLCEGGCGLTVRLVDGLPVGLKGNQNHPLNRGGLCPVGLAGLEVLYAPERLQGPLRRGPEGDHGATTWEAALEEISGRLAALREAGHGHRVALLSGEPSELFHDLANRFMNSLGSVNIARPDAAAVLPYKLAQGIDRLPGYDLARADLVVSFGLDLYEDGATPIHATSAMIGSRPSEERGALIQVGTRLSPSASKAEIYVQVRPGTCGAFALGVAYTLVRESAYDRDFVSEHTFGFDDWTDEHGRERLGFRRLLGRYYPDRVAQLCGCDPSLIVQVARRLGAAARPVAVAGGGAIQGTNAIWTAMAVQALNALVGAFDRPGGVVMPPPIPLTPLPPFPMPLASSVFSTATRAGAFGVDSVEALAEAVLSGNRPIEMLIVLDTNPVYSSPAGSRLRAALERIPTVVALTSFLDETAAAAEFVLPTPIFLERWQDSTTPQGIAFSTLGLGKPIIEPLADTRHPGDVLLDLGRQLGVAEEALPWTDYPAYLEQRLEGLAVSGQGSIVTGSFEESWTQFLEERGWRFLGEKESEGFWSTLLRESSWWNPVQPRGDWRRLFATASGRFEFFSRSLEARLLELGSAAEHDSTPEGAMARGIAHLGLTAVGDEACLPHHEQPTETGEGELTLLPFRPITARGSLGVTSPMVLEMFGYSSFSPWQTWVELSAETAHELDVADGDEVRVESDRGHFDAVARIRPGAAAGTLHAPLGLGHEESFSMAGGIGANPVEVMLPARDPLSGRLSQTSTRVRLRLVRRRARGGPAPRHGGSQA